MIPIIKKELGTYFRSMIGYAFLGFLILLTAVYFSLINILQMTPDYSYVLSGTSIIFLILIPTLTMRLFAEESRQKTDQLLFTAPVKIHHIVIGKYFAAFCLFLIGMVVTMVFPLIMSFYGDIPTAKIAGAFAGYILLGACFISVGMFVSVLTDNQIIAAVGTFVVLFLLFIMSGIAESLPADRTSSIVFVCVMAAAFGLLIYDSTKNLWAGIIVAAIGLVGIAIAYFTNNLVFDGCMVKIFRWFSVMSRFDNFNKGVLNLADVVYYISFSAAFVYLTVNVIEKRRWR